MIILVDPGTTILNVFVKGKKKTVMVQVKTFKKIEIKKKQVSQCVKFVLAPEIRKLT